MSNKRDLEAGERRSEQIQSDEQFIDQAKVANSAPISKKMVLCKS